MLTLTVQTLALSLNPEIDLKNVKYLQLEIPQAYYSYSETKQEWLENIYSTSLQPSKIYELKIKEELNIYNAYLNDYYSDEDIAFFNEATGRTPYKLMLHTRAWGGDSSGYAQGFSYSEQASDNLVWGFGLERAELKSNKHNYWKEGGYYNADAWLNWQPHPDVNIFVGAQGTFQE